MTEKIVIIDYGSGNLRSAEKSVQHVIDTQGLKATVSVTNRPEDVREADRVILPGQGAFADCMAGLKSLDGMIDALREKVIQNGAPFLGICVGMQLLASRGLEHGVHDGLGWIAGDVVPLAPSDPALKIPHMGWNIVHSNSDRFMMQGITKKAGNSLPHFYFVHSFMVECKDQEHVLAQTNYGGDVTAIIGRDNIIGTQFHPEKSHEDGLKFLNRFLNWKP